MTDEDLAAAVAAAIAATLGFPPGATPTQRVLDAAAASVALVRWFLYGDTVTDPPTPPPPLPSPTEGPDMYLGLQALAVRVYHDPASPGGVVGGDAFTGAAIPEDLLAHVHHYFGRYKRSWGIA